MSFKDDFNEAYAENPTRHYEVEHKVRKQTEALGANYDVETLGTNQWAFVVCGTLMHIACVQSFIDGLNAR